MGVSLITKGKICFAGTAANGKIIDNRIVNAKLNLKLQKNIKINLKKVKS